MNTIGWRFPPLFGGTRQSYTNNDIEAFKGEELIDNLAREICQNSLDAKDTDILTPVKVVFELKHIPTRSNSVFVGYRKCIEGCREYWGKNTDAKLSRFLDDAEAMLSRDTIPVLIVGDYNTSGLVGSRSRDLSSSWEALTGADGMSVKNNNDTSAGSFGIGKNAPFACSSLSMVFYNTYADDEESAFIGVARLATLYNSQGRDTQRVGRYQNNDDEKEKWTPIFNNDTDTFRDTFSRSEKGTDVIIAGFNQEDDWVNSVSKAVLKSFFVAINEKNLVVEIKDDTKTRVVINDQSLSQVISEFSNDTEMIITAQLFKAFTYPDKMVTLSVLSENDAEVYIKSESAYSRRIAHFRDTGMLIYLNSRRILQHYAAVLIIRGKKLNELLRATEPARHNKWDYKLISGASEVEKQKRKDAKSAIKKIDDSILELLKNQYEGPTEDSIDAVGVGEYLPDYQDEIEGSSAGDDILKAKIKIGKVKILNSKLGIITDTGIKSEGVEEKGDIHNQDTNPNPLPSKPLPSIVNPDGFEGEQKEGVKQGKGPKTVTLPNLSAQRAFPINSSDGLYKIVIKPTEAYNNLYVTCSALGEDGRSDILNMESFTYNRSPINIGDGKAGPIKVEAEVPAIFFVRFSIKEKMVLTLQLTEEPKK